MILEGLVTTVDAYGEVNISPMGPRVDASMSRLVLRPYQTAKTYQNLKRVGEGVFHVTDDVLLITTIEKVSDYARIRAYRVSELIDSGWESEELVEMLGKMFDDIDDETIVGKEDRLVVRATVETHQQIEQVLAAEPTLKNRHAPAAFVCDVPGRIATSYERDWRADGRQMHFFDYGRALCEPGELDQARELS